MGFIKAFSIKDHDSVSECVLCNCGHFGTAGDPVHLWIFTDVTQCVDAIPQEGRVCRPFQIGLRKVQLCSAHLTLLSDLQRKKWDWYLEFLYSQGLKGLKVFIESSISRVSQASRSKAGNVEM